MNPRPTNKTGEWAPIVAFGLAAIVLIVGILGFIGDLENLIGAVLGIGLAVMAIWWAWLIVRGVGESIWAALCAFGNWLGRP